MALSHELLFAFAPRADTRVRVQSENFPGEISLDLAAPLPPEQGDWGDYLRGAVFALKHYGQKLSNGLDGLVSGDDRIGGLSSSAAVGCAYLLALEDVGGLACGPDDNVELDRRIENDYIGLRNGLLDQTMILRSRRGMLTWLDCASGETGRLSLPDASTGFRILVAYSGLGRVLVGTDYNRRVDECREAARLLLEAEEGAPLREVPEEILRANAEALPEPYRRRARHFMTEMERVRQGLGLWEEGDLAGFGALVSASGESSIENYECGDPHLRGLCEILRGAPGVLGARFSGAGFRGCCIALTQPDADEELATRVLSEYCGRFPDVAGAASVYFSESADGASVLAEGEE
jgi:galactokinase